MSPSDRIELRGLHLSALVGVLPHEHDRAQPIEIDLDVVCDLAAAGVSDDLVDTVDYGALCDLVEAVVDTGHVELLETLAERMAASVLAADGRIAEVIVAVRKLEPPVRQALVTSGVRITRRR